MLKWRNKMKSDIIFIIAVIVLAVLMYILCRFRINGAPFSRQRCKRLAPAVRCPFIACL